MHLNKMRAKTGRENPARFFSFEASFISFKGLIKQRD